MAFVRRRINLTFILGVGAFGTDGSDQVKVSGLRISAEINKPGGAGFGTADLRIYGLSLSLMKRLSSYGIVYENTQRNSVIIEAGDDNAGMATIFTGQILTAWFDGSDRANVAFVVSASAGSLLAVTPAPPLSIQNPTPAAEVISLLASKANLAFQNDGVTTPLNNGYFCGTLHAQIAKIISTIKCESSGLNGDHLLTIWPQGTSRNLAPVVISPETGMIGFPTWSGPAIIVRTLLNGAIVSGSPIRVTSSIINASQPEDWVALSIDYALDSMVPNGRWFMTTQAFRAKLIPANK